MQAVLVRRRSELERDLQNARGTAFENPDTSRVSLGTIVTVRDKASKKQETYTVLGAWDGDPDRNIISYQTAIGQALLGHKGGETVTLPNGAFEILSIEPAPVDKPVAETISETEPASV
jgi:transcription elongation GreA/GreB family factor